MGGESMEGEVSGLMLGRLKKRLIAILDAVEGVKTSGNHLMLAQSDFDQMRRIMIH